MTAPRLMHSQSGFAAAMANISWGARWVGDDIPVQTDATALASWSPRTGSADAAVLTGSGSDVIYKTAANGINGHAVARFQAAKYLKTTLGGAAYKTGTFYMALVVKHTSLTGYQWYIDMGDGAGAGTRDSRGLFKFTNSGGNSNAPTFVADTSNLSQRVGADSTTPLTTNACLVEAYCDGAAAVEIFLNGRRVARANLPGNLVTYTGTAIYLGSSRLADTFLNADVAEIVMADPQVARQIRHSILLPYFGSTYNLWTPPAPALWDSAALTDYGNGVTSDGTYTYAGLPMVVGPTLTPLMADSTSLDTAGWTIPAMLSVYGPLVADASYYGANHTLIGNVGNDGNVLTLLQRANTASSSVRMMTPANSGVTTGEGANVACSRALPEGRNNVAGSLALMGYGATDVTLGGSIRFLQFARLNGANTGIYVRAQYIAADGSGADRAGDFVEHGVDNTNAEVDAYARRAETTSGTLSIFVEEDVDGAVAAAGTTQGTAFLLRKPVNVVTTCTAAVNDGVQLNAGPRTFALGRKIEVYNESGAAAKVWPPSGHNIDDLAANASFALADNAHTFFRRVSATRWLSK